MAMIPSSDSSFDRAVRALADLTPGERMELASYVVARELERDRRTRSLEGCLLELRHRIREIQARARS